MKTDHLHINGSYPRMTQRRQLSKCCVCVFASVRAHVFGYMCVYVSSSLWSDIRCETGV